MRGGVIELSASNTKKSKILSGLKIGACLFFLSTIMVSSGAFAYTKQEETKIQNFIEDNVAHVDRLTVSDVRKALPFMSEDEAREWLAGMRKMLGRHANVGLRLAD